MLQLAQALINLADELTLGAKPGGAALLIRLFELESPTEESRPAARDLCCTLARKLQRSYVKFMVRLKTVQPDVSRLKD